MAGEGYRLIDKRFGITPDDRRSSFTERVGIMLVKPKIVPSELDGLDGIPPWMKRIVKKNITK